MLWLLAMVAPLAQTPPPTPDDPPPLLHGPELIDYIEAIDPQIPREGEISVLMLLEIGADGVVARTEILQSGGAPYDEAARAAASRWRFRPAEDETGPVPVTVEFTYVFPPPEPKPEEIPAPVDARVWVTGRLFRAGSREGVVGASVSLASPSGELLAEGITAEDGSFALGGLPEQTTAVTLTLRHPGYQDVRKDLTLSSDEQVDISLWAREDTRADNEIVVWYDRRDEQPEITRRTITIDEIRRVPGTFGDPVRIIQSLPGTARPPFASGLLVLRGANPDDSNVYIDGVEVPIVYHLGGYRSVLNPDLVSAVDYLPGGYSVRYGRSLGGVVDVRTKKTYPEHPRATVRADLLDSGALVEGRVKDLGYSIAARRSYVDVVLGLVLRKQEFQASPRWYDYQLKLSHLGVPGELSLLLFGFDDRVVVRTAGDTRPLGAGYSTHRAVISLRHPITETLELWVQPSIGVVHTEYGLGRNYLFELSADTIDLRSELIFTPGPALTAKLGFDGQGTRNDFVLFLGNVPVDDGDPLSETESRDMGRDLRQLTPDPYVEATLSPIEDRDALKLIAGLRMPWLLRDRTDTQHAFDPRLQVRLHPFSEGLLGGSTLKAGTGLYHQPPTGLELGREEEFERAASSEIGLEQQITASLRADITAYHRYIGDPRIFKTKDQEEERDSIGRAYGVETMVRLSPTESLFGWVSYTLSKSEYNYDPDDPEEPAPWIPSDYDQTHIFTAVGGGNLPYRFGVSGRATYVTGNPYTPLQGGIFLMDQGNYLPYALGDANSERQPPFWALDLRVDKRFAFRQWSLLLFLDLLNTLHGKNPEFPVYNYDFTETDYIASLPFLPAAGLLVEMNF